MRTDVIPGVDAVGAPGETPPPARPDHTARRRQLSTRAHLVALVAAILLPLVAGAGLLLWRYAGAERARYHQQALELARQLALDTDRELDGAILVLRTLATAPALEAGDLAAFDAQAREVVPLYGDIIGLRDRTGQQLVDTLLPRGTPPPVTASEEVRATDARLFATGEPQVSDLLAGTTAERPLLLVDVPVARDGAVAYALSMVLTPERLSRLLAAGLPSPEWVASLLDREDRIIARTKRPEEFVGRLASDDTRRNAVGDEGTWTGTTVEGTPVLAAFARSRVSGWRAGAGVPVALVEAPLRRPLRLLLGGAALVLAGSTLVAAWWGRRLVGPVRRLAEAAAALGRGREVAPVASPVRELSRVGDALAAASAGLRRRARERDEAEAALRASEARYRTVFEQAAVGIKQVALADGRILAANGAVCRMLGYTPDELLRLGAADIVHPDDLPAERAQLARLLSGEIASYAIEKRYLRKGGEPVWARVTSSLPRGGPAAEPYRISIVEDVTARKAAEEHQRLLLGELSHRVKNTLAVVRSIAARTFAGDRPPGEAGRIFEERLGALARAHAALAASAWIGAGLRELVEAELRPFGARAALDGPAVALAPKAAQTLALVLHELATNAAKYGSLSTPEGRVEVTWGWEEAPGPEGRRLRLRWRERGGPPVAPPVRRGFGRTLVEQGWRYELGGEVAVDFRPDGLVCELSVPARVASAA